MAENLKYAALLLVLVIVQKTLVWLIAVTSYEVTPDIVLVGLAYVGIKRGKIDGSIAGFLSGLLLDLFSFSFIGLMALSKSAAGFLSGFFNNENKIERYLSSYGFVLIVFFCSIVNNIFYFTIYFQGTNLVFSDVLLRYILPTAVYTSIISIIPVIFARKKIRRL
ncbi:MAG: rod shape-determining protein MreD [Chlorobi bacterium]|nr:rod shape-determining protein MreD [Chlorobiota bacterium]MCI0716909.1 rod shape-determining protein MreD [Chlorobiota bacterium]